VGVSTINSFRNRNRNCVVPVQYGSKISQDMTLEGIQLFSNKVSVHRYLRGNGRFNRDLSFMLNLLLYLWALFT
jgi:hypothetical protein